VDGAVSEADCVTKFDGAGWGPAATSDREELVMDLGVEDRDPQPVEFQGVGVGAGVSSDQSFAAQPREVVQAWLRV
jgi:hypothetical protein